MRSAVGFNRVYQTKDTERFLTVETLKRAVGMGNKETGDRDMALLTAAYAHGLQFSTNLSSSEIKPSDGFVKLAVSRLYDEWRADGEERRPCGPLVESLVLLKGAIEQSGANYHLRLQLSHLLGMLACPELLANQFDDLEIKQLMWDSIGYLFILPILRIPSFQQRVQFFKRNIDRKLKNKVEIEDSLVTCYK